MCVCIHTCVLMFILSGRAYTYVRTFVCTHVEVEVSFYTYAGLNKCLYTCICLKNEYMRGNWILFWEDFFLNMKNCENLIWLLMPVKQLALLWKEKLGVLFCVYVFVYCMIVYIEVGNTVCIFKRLNNDDENQSLNHLFCLQRHSIYY